MSDNEDYMSDKFLQASTECTPPSLLYRRSDRREHTMMKKKAETEAKMKELNKPIRLMEIEKREIGLSSAITTNNKGFEMLVKMGYRPGLGIGRTQSGMTEPISVRVKADRQGLGKTLNEKASRRHDETRSNLDSLNTKSFRSRIAEEKTKQLQKIDLRKSQKICRELDAKENIENPCESWFWPENKEDEPDNVNDDNGKSSETDIDDECLNDFEKLDILIKYLRKKYFYCIWCGMKFNDEDDLRDDCPGSTRTDH